MPDTDPPRRPQSALDPAPNAQGTPIPSPPPPLSGTPDGAFRLDTGLLGPLLVPGGAARAAELEALSATRTSPLASERQVLTFHTRA